MEGNLLGFIPSYYLRTALKGRINGALILLSEALLSDSQVIFRPLL